MSKLHKYGFITRAVHAGERLWRGGIRPVTTPIHPSVGYTFESAHELDDVLGAVRPGFVYSTRYANPTVDAFEQAVAELEGAEAAQAFSSGMAAIHLALLAAGARAGKSIVAAADVYGATYSLLRTLLAELGVQVHFVDVLDLPGIEKTVQAVHPAALLVETLSNPLLKVADLPRLAEIAHADGAMLLVDNTFCSPYLVNPLRYGADMAIHSATKYLSGHGDVMAGIIATSSVLKEKLYGLNKLLGSSLGPFEAWLALRGLKTLPLRMRRQCDNALALAEWLQTHPKVERVNYAFLPNHPQYALMHLLSGGKGAGGVFSFEIRGAGRDETFSFLEALELIQPATTLGDIYTLTLYPASASHRSLTPAERAAVGIGDGLVRISAGIEDFEDIQADLAQALDRIG